MKILHCHTSLSSGGIEAMITGLVNKMNIRHDVDVCLIFKPKKSDVFFNRLDKNIRCISLGKVRSGFSLKYLFKIYSIVKKREYDVVQLHGFFYYYILMILFCHRRTKIFYTIHNDAKEENVSWDKYFVWLKRICFKYKLVHPITISKSSQLSFYNLYHTDSFLIYNGVPKIDVCKIDLSEYRKTDRTCILFNPARITEQKNQIMLCNSVLELVKEGYDIVLLIAGTIQDMYIYDTIINYSSDRIIFLGERSDTLSLMKSVDAMCLSSSWEGMPITLLEAFSCGCVSICTPVGGIPDVIVNNENGILSVDCSQAEYTIAIRSFLNMKEEDRNKMRECSAFAFEQFDINKTALQYESVYKLINSKS